MELGELIKGLIKPLAVPDGRAVPRELAHEGIRATAITRHDLDDDVRGINASLDLIRRTRGGRWPTGPVTHEDNYVDLVWHECEFRDGGSFTYVVRDDEGRYLGCAYLYPLGGRTRLTEELLAYDVDVSWWVTEEAYAEGYYPRLAAALEHWVRHDTPFEAPYVSNVEVP